MQLFQTLARLRRGEMNLVLLAVFVALLVLPAAGHAAALPPQSCEAVLLWLQSDGGMVTPVASRAGSSLLSLTHRQPERASDSPRDCSGTPTAGSLSFLGTVSHPECAGKMAVPAAANLLSSHEVAHLSGVRTNRRLH